MSEEFPEQFNEEEDPIPLELRSHTTRLKTVKWDFEVAKNLGYLLRNIDAADVSLRNIKEAYMMAYGYGPEDFYTDSTVEEFQDVLALTNKEDLKNLVQYQYDLLLEEIENAQDLLN